MRPRSALSLVVSLALVTACAPGVDAPLAPRAAAASPSPFLVGQELDRRRIDFTPFREELLEASAGLLYTSESDYPFDYVSRPLILRDTVTTAAFRLAFLIPRSTPVEIRDLDRFFARHIELVDPYDAASVALVPRYENLKYQIRELLNAPKAFCVGTIQVRCYVVGTSPDGIIAGLATTAIET